MHVGSPSLSHIFLNGVQSLASLRLKELEEVQKEKGRLAEQLQKVQVTTVIQQLPLDMALRCWRNTLILRDFHVCPFLLCRRH